MVETMEHCILENEKNERIDKVIRSLNKEWSRSKVQQWIKDGYVHVNGKRVKANYICHEGDVITIRFPKRKKIELQPEDIKLDILYEDSDLLVVNKPKGMVVHPAHGHMKGTLVNGLLAHCHSLSTIGGKERPGIVHRIDKDTSGLLVVAKNDETHQKLVEQLIDQSMTRKYVTLVHGVIPHDNGTIDAPIARDSRERKRMTVVEGGKDAVTHFRVLKRFSHYTLVECQLETGRTHQIRVHLRYIGHPLVGDPKYGPPQTIQLDGQALYANVLGFIHPRTEEYLEFEAPLPEYFARLLDSLQK